MSETKPETAVEETTLERLQRIAAENKAKEAGAVTGVDLSNKSQSDIDTEITKAVSEQEVPIKAVKAAEVVAAVVVVEKSYHVYFNTVASCKMLTDSGRVISFVGGKYITDAQEEIEYLDRELNHPDNIYLSQVAGKEVMTATELDPMAVLRKEHLEEFKALQAEAARKIAAGEPLSQSESEVQPLTPGSTADIASLAAGSAGT